MPTRSVGDDDDDDEGLSLLRQDVLDVKELQKLRALEIRRLLAEGEENDWSPPHSTGNPAFIVFCCMACHLPVLDGFDQLLSFFGIAHTLSCALQSINLSNVMKFWELPRIKPGVAGGVARTL